MSSTEAQRAKLSAPDITFPFRNERKSLSNLMTKQCPAIAYGWCQAPWSCAQTCTGRGGNSFATPTNIGAPDGKE